MKYGFNEDKSKFNILAAINDAVSSMRDGLVELIDNKANLVHFHSGSDITSGTIDVDRIPTIPQSKISNLDASKLTSGILPVQRGGTGQATLKALRNAIGLGGDTSSPVPIASGGTGATTASAARNALGLGNTTGALPVRNGGTGVTTAKDIRQVLGLGNTTGALPVANGGTGATTAAGARSNIGANNASNLTSGTVPRARIESTTWAYLYGNASSTNYSRWRMRGGVVFIEINYESSAGVGTTAASFGVIPDGYRPSRLVTAAGYLGHANNNISAMWVKTNGEILVAAAASSSTFYGSMCYPL